MRLAPLALALLAACGSTRGTTRTDPKKDDVPRTSPHDSNVVAFIDGVPVTWREVADRVMELDLKGAVDTYLKWKVLEDLKKKHGITHTPEEMQARARAVMAQWRKVYGEDGLKRQLEAQKTTEEAYVVELSKSAWLMSSFAMEKAYRYCRLVEGWVEIDWMQFVEETDAKAFLEGVKAGGFDKTVEEWAKRPQTGRIGRVPRSVFTSKSAPREIDDYIVESVFALSDGGVTGVEISHVTNLHYVIKVVKKQAPRPEPYEKVKDEVFQGIVKDPPAQEEVRDWFNLACRAVKVLYENRETPKDKNR